MTILKIGDSMPDFTLPDHTGEPTQLSSLNRASEMDKRLGFTAGYPLIVVFYRGFFCPRDQAQFHDLVAMQDELDVSAAARCRGMPRSPAVGTADTAYSL